MSQAFADHFSKLAPRYHNRPQYPEDLFQHLAHVAPGRTRAWDAGTGGGQAAVRLAEYFDEVIATDASEKQIRSARLHPRVQYRVALSEQSSLPDQSFDLVTAAQALHWFRLEEFYREVRRVLKPRGIMAVWCYGLESVDEKVDRVTHKLHDDMLGPYWPKRTIEDHTYGELVLPFEELPRQTFRMEMTWTMMQFLESFRTWSAALFYKEDHGVDPLDLLEPEFTAAWGDPAQPRRVTWPVYVRCAIMDGGVSGNGAPKQR